MFNSILVLSLIISTTNAQTAEQLARQELFDQYEARGEIAMDNVLLHRREAIPDGTIAMDTTAIASATGTSNTGSPTASNAPLPSAFDTSLGSNFTSNSCPTFFNNFLTNSTFTQCSPLSLLIQNSQGFFSIQRSKPTLHKLLEKSCSAPISICAATMTDLARQLILDSNCGSDFVARQPLVMQAYNGLLGYEPLAQASCLKTSNYTSATIIPSLDTTTTTDDDDDAEYCFIDALMNKQNPSDPFPYYTAIGMNLPTGQNVPPPTCNGCLRAAMTLFARAAVHADQPLSMTYATCARAVDGACGAGFADTNVAVGSVASDTGIKNAMAQETNAAIRPRTLSWSWAAGVVTASALLLL
jgi:hypothetical protein